MRRLSWPLVAGIAVVLLAASFALRDVIYQMIIVPLAYAWWVIEVYYASIPQALLWTVLLALLLLGVLWSLIPEVHLPGGRDAPRGLPEGQVEALAIWLRKSRGGNYFKWQLANRLGRIARSLGEDSSGGGRVHSADETVERYLDAGLNYSFVDFPSRRNRLQPAPRTPLDADPNAVAEYLESQMEKTSDRRG